LLSDFPKKALVPLKHVTNWKIFLASDTCQASMTLNTSVFVSHYSRRESERVASTGDTKKLAMLPVVHKYMSTIS
jgi:hypothetical protein